MMIKNIVILLHLGEIGNWFSLILLKECAIMQHKSENAFFQIYIVGWEPEGH